MPLVRCPPRELLGNYLLGRIASAAAEAIESHVTDCQPCRTILIAGEKSADPLVQLLRQELGEGEFDREPELLRALGNIVNSRYGEPAFKRRAASRNTNVPEDHGFQEARLGPYRLIKVLGEGGMGLVYQAEHERLEMVVALKILGEEMAGNPQAVARFTQEMKAVGRVSHPNIVRATDAGVGEGRHYLAMEFVDGQDLSQILRTRGPLRINDACEVIRQVANGIQHAHDVGLIHRDLKPSNLMISREGQVKVLDLGLARLHIPTAGRGLTADFQIMGTADYMAPEQAFQATDVDHRVDIYGLGCTMYALLCGEPPFAGEKHPTSLRKLVAHEQESPTAAHLRRDEIPLELSAIIDRMLAKSPEERFASAAELAAMLAPFAAGADLALLVDQSDERNDSQSATSGLANYVTMLDSVKTSVDDKRISCPKRRVVPWGWLIGVVLGLLLSGAWLSAVLIEWTPREGTIAVVIEDPRIGVEIDRACAEWALGAGATVEVMESGIVGFVSAADRLPGGDFFLSNISFKSEYSPTDEEFAKLAMLQQLNQLTFNDIDLSDRMIERVRGLPHLTNLKLIYSKVSPTGLQKLGWLSGLSDLTVGGDRVGDAEVAVLCAASKVARVTISGTQVTDESMAILGQADHLEFLSLIFAQVTGREVRQLRHLPALWGLHLPYTKLTDDGLRHIAELRHVSWLNVGGTGITDNGLKYVAAMPSLDALCLSQSAITNAGLVHLRQAAGLRELDLQFTGIDDTAVDNLAALTQLRRLQVGDRLSADAVRRLKDQLPNCSIDTN